MKQGSIFEKVELNGLGCRNRIVRSATNDYCGKRDGSVSDGQLEIYGALADNNVGLIITGNFYASPDGMVDAEQNSLWENCDMDRLKALTARVHSAGGTIVAQISHAGAKSRVNERAAETFGDAGAISEGDIRVIAARFGEAAERAKAAGFDGVQIHCGHGYLLSSFIDARRNTRTDRYGGSVHNRFRFAREALEAARGRCGDYPLLVKLDSNINTPEGGAPFQDTADNLCDLLCVAEQCRRLGVAAVELSGGDFASFGRDAHSYYLKRAALVKSRVNVPVILVGGIRSLADMEAALAAGADMAALSRPFLREPDLVTRMMNGRGQSACVSCNRCFVLYRQTGRRCALHRA